jgi:hypothetical protein
VALDAELRRFWSSTMTTSFVMLCALDGLLGALGRAVTSSR